VIRLGEAAGAKQVGFLDVSMSGGIVGAEAARLCFMVGGEERPFELCRPVLEASAKAIVHLGPLGSGITAKVIQNAIYGITKQGAYEGLSLATAAGLDLAKFGEALHYSTGQSYAADGVFERASNRAAANEPWGGPGMHSVEMALDLAKRYGLELPALKNAHAFFKRDHSATERMPHGVSSRPNS